MTRRRRQRQRLHLTLALWQLAAFAVLFVLLLAVFRFDPDSGALCVIVGMVYLFLGSEGRRNIAGLFRYVLTRDDDDPDAGALDLAYNEANTKRAEAEAIGRELLFRLLSPEQHEQAK